MASRSSLAISGLLRKQYGDHAETFIRDHIERLCPGEEYVAVVWREILAALPPRRAESAAGPARGMSVPGE